MFVHAVYFWLKPGTNDTERARLIDDCTHYLAMIPVVQHLWVGRPAMTPRTKVDNSYDVGLCVVFDDRAAHDLYQTHELHDEFVARNKHIFDREQIYDMK